MIKKLYSSQFSVYLELFSPHLKKLEVKPLPKGDPIRGEKLVGSCAACHGADGNSLVGMWPTLAGQRELYLFDQLHHIQEGERVIESMMGLLDDYNDDDLRDMAAYYASQKIKVGQASDENVLLGQTIIELEMLHLDCQHAQGVITPKEKELIQQAILLLVVKSRIRCYQLSGLQK